MNELPQTFIEFLKLIGSPVFIGVAVSLLVRESPWFELQKPIKKVLVVFGICMGFPIISNVLLLYLPVAVVAFLEMWWPVLMTGVGAFIASQIWHTYTKSKVRQIPAVVKNEWPEPPTPDPANGLNMPG
jgi:hypothetical protein